MIRWIFRELRGSWQFCLLFILNISVGLVGFICLDAYKTTLSQTLQAQSKSFLSAELAVTARRILNEKEIKKVHDQLPPIYNEGHLQEFFSMVSGGNSSRLVQVKAIDDTYPFYGHIEILNGIKISGKSAKEITQSNTVWVYPELLTQMNLKVGDTIKLGEVTLKISNVIVEDTSQTFRLASLAPKIYVGLNQIQKTGLLGKGSTISDVYLYQFTEEPLQIANKVKLALEDNTIQVLTDKDASEDSGRVLGYLTDYLGLVSLIGLFMSFLGGVYLYRAYLYSQIKSIAIYNSLGLDRQKSQLLYVYEVAFLGLVAAVLSILISVSLLPILQKLLSEFTPIQLEVRLPGKTVFLALISGLGMSILVGLPFLRGLSRVQVATLFQEGSEVRLEFSKSDLLYFAPALVLFWFLTFWQANSITVTNIFVVTFLAALIVLALVGGALLQSLRPLLRVQWWPLRHALLYFIRKPISALVSLVSIGLGVLLIQLLPQLKTSLQSEIEMPKNLMLPSLFIFDIQPDQIDGLKSWAEVKKLRLNYLSPMVRGRILKHNNTAFESYLSQSASLTREEENEKRFRNRAVNISYREHLAESETIVEGQFAKNAVEGPDQVPELSLEKRYADRLGVKMGDVLTFDIQGIEISGQVTSFRKVKWNSFQPNFFILIQRGVLEDAPQSYLAAVPRIEEKLVDNYQRELTEKFPNVSMIDVSRIVKRILELTDKMSFSLEFMAFIALFAGFMVIYSMIIQQTRDRRWDLNMLKILGAHENSLAQMLLLEFFFISLIGVILGSALGLGVSWAISHFLFEGIFVMNMKILFIASVGVVILSLGLAYLATRKVIREKPASILQEGRL